MRMVYNLSMSKVIRKSLIPVLIICLAAVVLLAGCKSTSGQKPTDIVLQIEEGGITFFGNATLNITTRDFFEQTGFEYGDAVRVRFLDKDMVVPIFSTFSELDIGQTGLAAQYSDPGAPAEKIELFINLDDFSETNGIAENMVYDDGTWEAKPFDGIVFPIDVTLSMANKGAFPEFAGPPLAISNLRSSYEDLDDYAFANICVAMGKILALDCDFMVLPAERLHEETIKYLKSIGLTDKDIANLKANLARVR